MATPTKSYSFETPAIGPADGAFPANASPANEPHSAVTREVHSLLADIEDLITATTSLTGEDLAKARAKLAESVAAAKKAVADTGTAIAQGARRTATATDSYVHENPWQAVAIGAGVGVAAGALLGYLLAHRS